MKKIFAILLILAMILPMAFVVQAEEVETKPFYMNTWSQFESDLDNVYYMPFFWVNEGKIVEGEEKVTL